MCVCVCVPFNGLELCYDPIRMHKPKGRLKSPIKTVYMCLGSVRKPEDTEKTYAAAVKTQKVPAS